MVTTAEAVGVLYPTADPRFDYVVEAPGVIVAWNVGVLGAQPAQAQLDAVTEADVALWHQSQLRQRVLAYAQEADKTDLTRLVLGELLLMLDEFNAHATTINAILSAIDAASTLAQVKTNIAAIPDYPQRTKAQLVNALVAIINAGSVD